MEESFLGNYFLLSIFSVLFSVQFVLKPSYLTSLIRVLSIRVKQHRNRKLLEGHSNNVDMCTAQLWKNEIIKHPEKIITLLFYSTL